MIQNADEFVHLRLSENPEEYCRAAHESISEDVALDIIQKYPDMTKWVIHNKTVPLSILEMLAKHPDYMIRIEVARKRKLNRALFEKLASDEDENVRHALAYNRKIPHDILQNLAHDHSSFVAEVAQRKLKERNT